MIRLLMTAALILSLSLTAAGCGAGRDASATAHRWRDGDHTAQVQRDLARGGSYYADGAGRVNGRRAHSADGRRTSLGEGLRSAGEDLRSAGEDLARGAGDAARSVGDAAEDALDGLTGANAAPNASLNAGNSADPPVR